MNEDEIFIDERIYTSLWLSTELYNNGFIFDYYFIWMQWSDGSWMLMEDNGSVGYKRAYPAYDILNDLCVKYPKELFGKIFLEQGNVAWSFPHHSEMILHLLQDNKKEEAEKYIINNLFVK